MGRRSRAREREATAVAARPAPATPARDEGRRSRLGFLNPFKFQRPSRSRVRYAAVGFGLSAVLFAVLGWVTGEAGVVQLGRAAGGPGPGLGGQGVVHGGGRPIELTTAALVECLETTHGRVGRLLAGLPPAAWDANVPATPAWSVSDVVAHLADGDRAALATAQGAWDAAGIDRRVDRRRGRRPPGRDARGPAGGLGGGRRRAPLAPGRPRRRGVAGPGGLGGGDDLGEDPRGAAAQRRLAPRPRHGRGGRRGVRGRRPRPSPSWPTWPPGPSPAACPAAADPTRARSSSSASAPTSGSSAAPPANAPTRPPPPTWSWRPTPSPSSSAPPAAPQPTPGAPRATPPWPPTCRPPSARSPEHEDRAAGQRFGSTRTRASPALSTTQTAPSPRARTRE